MAGAFTVSHVFVAEKPVIEREYSTGFLSPSAHMVAKMLADVMVQLFFPVLFVTYDKKPFYALFFDHTIIELDIG